MPKEPMLAYLHVQKSIHEIEKFMVKNGDKKLEYGLEYLGIERLLETLSESTTYFPDDIKAKYPHIDWRKIKGFRNYLAHDYIDQIDDVIVIDVIKNYLPKLKIVVEDMIKNHE